MRFSILLLTGLVLGMSAAANSASAAAPVCKRQQGVSDRDAIAGVFARYAFFADAKDDAALADLFTADGVWESAGIGRFAGTAELRRLISSTPRGGRHITSDYIIDVAGTTATAQSHMLVIMFDGERPFVQATGSYEDMLVCTDGGWKIRSRKFVRATPPPAAPR